jgi:hypothetical protein
MQSIIWPDTYSQIKNAPIQFDRSGAIYYSGRSATGNTILRKYSNGQTTDLISDDVQLYGFIAVPDGGAIITGTTTATGASWTRRVTAEGSLRTLINYEASFLSIFADGNIYIGSWYTSDYSTAGVRRYLTASNQLDTREWISAALNNPGPSAYFWGQGFCGDSVLRTARAGFCSSSGVFAAGFFNTTDGKTFALAGNAPNTALSQYYPTIAFPTTIVKNISVAQGVLTHLILAGTDAANQNIMTLYDASNGAEEQLLGAENDIEIYHVNFVYEGGVSKVLFDGLRFSDNKYVLGQVDLSTKQVSVTSTIATKWSDFQTFG